MGELSTASVSGVPDGLATDVDDGVWVACYRGSAIIRIDAVSGAIDRFQVPAAKPLSLCFAGDELYVVTGSDDERGESGTIAARPFAGDRHPCRGGEALTSHRSDRGVPAVGHDRRRGDERGVV